MKYLNLFLTVLIFGAFMMSAPTDAIAQDEVRASLHASITQTLGLKTVITVDYSRPGVKGRTIWGELLPWGMNPGNKYSEEKPYPWRVGANENTTIEFGGDVLIEGKKVPAGKYGLHMIPAEKEAWVVIFNKVNDAWGSYAYDESKDALRINVKPVKAAFEEWLTFGFEELAGTEATCFVHWEKVKIPFKVKLVAEK